MKHGQADGSNWFAVTEDISESRGLHSPADVNDLLTFVVDHQLWPVIMAFLEQLGVALNHMFKARLYKTLYFLFQILHIFFKNKISLKINPYFLDTFFKI